MTFTVSKDPKGVLVVSVDGQLVVANRQELKQLVMDALASGDSRVAIDFSSTGYIDSSGLGVLVSISKKIREAGGTFLLCGLNDDLRMLFELTKLDTLFRIVDSREEAIAAL